VLRAAPLRFGCPPRRCRRSRSAGLKLISPRCYECISRRGYTRKSRPAEYNAAGKAKYLAKLQKEDEAYEEHMANILKREGNRGWHGLGC